MHRATLPLLFGLSGLLTGAGFLIASIPFALAYLPFAIALVVAPALAGPRLGILALMAGHFLWPALISGWGLIQLGTHPLAVAVGAIAAVMLVSVGVVWLGIGLSALVLAALPFFPANPLLVTGSILPGAGLWGLVALPILVTVIEIQRGIVMRGALLAALLVLPRVVMPELDPDHELKVSAAYEEIDISGDIALTELRHWDRILARVEDGVTVILGENIFTHDNHAAVFWWCHRVRARDITAMIGVLGPTGLGEVWRFDAATCPDPGPVHRAALGIPLVNAGWWPKKENVAREPVPETILSEPHWLICFEAFSLWRWVDLGMDFTSQDTPRPVVILANDYWTVPFATTLLRRKVAAQFAALLGVEVVHADRGKSFLKWRKPELTAPDHQTRKERSHDQENRHGHLQSHSTRRQYPQRQESQRFADRADEADTGRRP